MNKYIFIDFDGVITTPTSRWCIDPNKVKHIESIIQTTGAKLVISSSWSVGSRNAEEFVSKVFGLFSDLTKDVVKDSIFINSIIDVTDHMGSARGDEIQRWLDSHEVDSYVIIDDEDDMLEEQLFNFVQTDSYEGITEREVHLAIDVLNNKRINAPFRLNRPLLFKRYDDLHGRKTNLDSILMDYNQRFKTNDK